MKRTLITILAAILAFTSFAAYAENRAADTQYITIDPQAILPDASEYQREYPSAITKGKLGYDLNALLIALLGEGYEAMSRAESALEQEYESRDASKPYRYVYIDTQTDALDYSDAMVTGERDGEYQAPSMNVFYDESLPMCKTLLSEVVDPSWLEYPGIVRQVKEKWSDSRHWKPDSEYAESVRGMDKHFFVFEHHTADDVNILGDRLTAAVGVNGLDSITLSWHDFTPCEETILPMPLDDAIRLADAAYESPTILLYAQLVYSNWLAGSDEYNLSWYLVTSQGDYVVDCVLGKCMCDALEA